MQSMAEGSPFENGFMAAFTFSVLANLLGNSLVCYVVLFFRDMRIPMNYLLVNLAVSDMMVAVFLIPIYILSRFMNHPTGALGSILCKTLTSDVLAWTGALASNFTLVCVAFERYLAVTYPYEEKKRLTSKKLKYVIPLCWFFAIADNVPLFISYTYDNNSESCALYWPTENFIKYHSIINSHIFVVFPVTIMVILYARLVNKLWFKSAATTTISQLALLKNRRRSTKMVIMVSVIYCICWFPNCFAYIYVAYSSKQLFNEMHIASVLMVSLNSAINPIIYSLQSHRFRRHIAALFSRVIRRDRVQVSPISLRAQSKEINALSTDN